MGGASLATPGWPEDWQPAPETIYWNRFGSIVVGECHAYNADVEEHPRRDI